MNQSNGILNGKLKMRKCGFREESAFLCAKMQKQFAFHCIPHIKWTGEKKEAEGESDADSPLHSHSLLCAQMRIL